MSASVPWSVNAVDPEAWAEAREAARRSGLSVGEWLETAIREAANDRGRPRREQTPARAREQPGDGALLASIAALNERIDALAHDVRAGGRNGPAEVRTAIERLDDRIGDLFARNRMAQAGASPEVERRLADISRTIETMSRLLQQENARQSVQPAPASVEELDDAVADIMFRQSALDGAPPPRARPRREAAPDLSGFERQLKLMADEMQALRRAGPQAESIETVRRDIAELAGRLNELAPRRSLEALEKAVEAIVLRLDRVAAGRRDEGYADISETLHDIRAALTDVRPAESFSAVERDLQALSRKLDGLGGRGVDGDALQRLQAQTEEIRGLLAGALPSDVLKALVDQIELLVRKFETGSTQADDAIVDILSAFDRRLEALSERIETAGREGPAGPALDAIRQRLDELQAAVARTPAPDAGIEATLRMLAEKIDATEARLGNLGAVEHGLAELVARLEDARTGVRESAERAAKSAMRELAAQVQVPAPAVPDWPRRPPAELETRFSSAPAPRPYPAAEEPGPAAQTEFHPQLAPLRPMQAAVTAAPDGELPEDYPLEPGSGAPRMRLQSAALRVAQSEAALGGIAAPAAEPPGRTSDFIAAARRAAQAASAEAASVAEAGPASPLKSRIGAVFGKGRRAFLIALAAFLVIFTALRVLDAPLPILFGGQQPLPAVPAGKEPKAPPSAAAPADEEAVGTAGPARTGTLSMDDQAIAAAPPAGVIGDGDRMPFFGGSRPAPETTGSARAAQPAETAAAPAEAVPEIDTGLPAAIGPQALRVAAAAGDPSAAYEIAMRYLEGRGVRPDPAEARAWFERAFQKGSAPAAYRLGSMYEKGHGGERSPAEAQRFYTIAAEAGNIKAMHNLAVSYAEGPEGEPDYRTAARWFRLAAERGVRDSQYNLGVLYARGLGVEQNLAESFRWFALAASQGDADAAGKRDDVAKRLDTQTLVATRLAVQTWRAAAADPAANEVSLQPDWEPAAAPARKRSVKK